MTLSVFERLEQLLRTRGASFQVLRHPPVYTSEAAAAIRGTTLSSGAKALVCKADQRFLMFVLPADCKLDSKRLRRDRGWKNLRFANRDEVLAITGLAPGSIPPFGSLFGLSTLCDPRLTDNVALNFNAGDHSVSISMSPADYLRVEQPELVPMAEGASAVDSTGSRINPIADG